MPENLKRLPAAFYRATSGAEPVREWLLDLPVAARKSIGQDIALVEYGWPLGMPTCRPLKDGLLEVRSNLPDGRIARVLFCIADGRIVLLHGFIKKTQKTPPSDLATARTRQRDVQR